MLVSILLPTPIDSLGSKQHLCFQIKTGLSYQARLAVPIPATLQKAGDRGKSSFNLSDFSQWIISAMLRSVQVFEEPEVLLLAIQAFVEASLKKSSLFH